MPCNFLLYACADPSYTREVSNARHRAQHTSPAGLDNLGRIGMSERELDDIWAEGYDAWLDWSAPVNYLGPLSPYRTGSAEDDMWMQGWYEADRNNEEAYADGRGA